MKISAAEKLIIIMLSDIYDRLELTSVDTKLLRSALASDNSWAIDWEMPGLSNEGESPTPPLVISVVNYIDMWAFLEEAYNALDQASKEKVAIEAAPFGKHVRFPGFDGNNEAEALSIARILIDDMGRFGYFKGRDLNSHAPTLEAYSRMYKVFEKFRPTLTSGKQLSSAQIASVLVAMHHKGE